MSVAHSSPTLSRRSAVIAGLALTGLASPWMAQAQVASPAATMTEEGLRQLEATRLRSLVDFDLDTASALHADDFQLINPLGGALSKADYLGQLADGFIDYLVFEPASEIAVRLVPGAGILRYQANLEIVVAGSPIPLRKHWHTDYYEERDGTWAVVWSHATVVAE